MLHVTELFMSSTALTLIQDRDLEHRSVPISRLSFLKENALHGQGNVHTR